MNKHEMRQEAIKRLNEMYEAGPYTTQDIVVALAGSSGWVGRIIDLLTYDEPSYEGDAFAKGPRDADGVLWFSGDMSDTEWGVIEKPHFDGDKWMIRGHDLTAPWVPADSIRHAPMRTATQREDDIIKLPKDANGEVIHVGDELCGYGKTIEVVELRIGRSGWVIVSRDGNAYADTYAFTHYRLPTVEDVLREFAEKIEDSQIPGTHPTYEEAIAEYAKRMQLKEGGNEGQA